MVAAYVVILVVAESPKEMVTDSELDDLKLEGYMYYTPSLLERPPVEK